MIGTITLTSCPTPGSLLGTMGSQDLINSINSASGVSTYFGSDLDPCRTGYKYFMSNVVQPIRELGIQLKSTANKLFNNDYIRPINTISELEKGIPSSMYDAFALYEPINKMAIQGRVDCFGYNREYLENMPDYWGRLISNGNVDLTRSVDKDGNYTVTWIEESSDPIWTIEQLEAITETRKFIDEFYKNKETSKYDITSYPDEHG